MKRRPELALGLNPAGFLALPRAIRPTLLIDQSDFTPQMRGLLRAANGSGAYVTRAGRFFDPGSVKAIFSNDVDCGPTRRFCSVRMMCDGRVRLPRATDSRYG